MEEREQKAAIWRGERELSTAVTAEQTGIAKTALTPVATERLFGDSPEADLPALELQLPGGDVVLVQGVIDRVDVLAAQDASLGVVFDYKRSIGRRLLLDEVYHGLALQLLAYLLVLRDHGERLTGAKVVPGGAFYLPLLGRPLRVDHPDDADDDDFNPFKTFQPRGVVDFDSVGQLDPTFETGRSAAFAVQRTKAGAISRMDQSDAVRSGELPMLLRYVRRKMTGLAEQWTSGDISVSPAQLGRMSACARCPYRTVCRIEYAARESRVLSRMSRSEVLNALAERSSGGSDG
jgi:ATP-dependent helicase/nuclease subunit B